MRVAEGAEAVELVGARAYAATHLRTEEHNHTTFCGRDARGARVLPKLNQMDFDPVDPELHMCRTCVRLARRYSSAVLIEAHL